MITIKEFPEITFNSDEEAIKHLVANKKFVASAKKAVCKYADAYYSNVAGNRKEAENKEAGTMQESGRINIAAVANACNYFDSHGDVSINGSWNRTAKNTKDGLHLQEHKMQFDKLISDKVTFKVESKTWKELGYDYEGSTECLMMYSEIEKSTNPYMFDMYAQGRIKNHSAGLRYVNIELAVNNSADWAKDEKEIWDKYYPMIVNKDDVDDCGYFWAVIEQKIIETSAVLKGSNPATPTISVEPADSTSTKNDDPADATHQSEQTKSINLNLF